MHDRYVVRRGDRTWPTWHPPRDPRYDRAFGHEHGSDPRAFRHFRRSGMPAFGRIGTFAEVGTSWMLTRRIGYQRTFELFAGGRHVSGREAHELGIANELVEHEQLVPAARAWCDRLAELPDTSSR